MTNLSPAAFAVVDAFVCANARKTDPSSNADIAAALRAVAAAQKTCADTRVGVTSEVILVDDILAIADELEGAS